MSDTIGAGLTAALHIAVVAVVFTPLIWWRARRADVPAFAPGGVRRLAAMAGLYLVAATVLALPRVGFFADLTWNWQNKLVLAALLALLVTFLPSVTWREIGLRAPRPGWWLPVMWVTAVMLGVSLLGEPSSLPAANGETVAYQAIVPGIDEELLFRGVLLVMLARAFTGGRAMWGATPGWEVAITSVLFGIGHALTLTEGVVEFDPASFITTGVAGLVFAWIRIRWDSLLPAVLAHNGINLAAVAAAAIMT